MSEGVEPSGREIAHARRRRRRRNTPGDCTARRRRARAHGPLAALYGEVRAALRPAPGPAAAPLLADPPRDLAATTRNFFRDIFPLAYHNILRLDTKQFTADYEVCLKDAYDAVQPFGEVPQQVGATLSKSVAARARAAAGAGRGRGRAGGRRAGERARRRRVRAASAARRRLRALPRARRAPLPALLPQPRQRIIHV
ncbi:hypothetical protein MSG28_000546 [Choristoneura fumiferana]|uniref:Uncharacterized protein n=1 Tax=Choristoneura fumiferana TaxID=7141 RepID=A0ACC0K1D0_CHOFU|nr:hypothetical protein MSG28_000546 [Choristoneura fumiferana]